MDQNFEQMLISMRPENPKKIAVAAAEDRAVLGALSRAHSLGLCVPILCGDAAKIRENASALGIDISAFEIKDITDPIQSIAAAVALVRDGFADVLMKGLCQTADLMRAVLNKDTGIRGDGIISHVSIMYSDAIDHKIFMTDVAMIPYPDLKTKIQMVKNAVFVAHKFGVMNPNVVPLAAVENVNPSMIATTDAAELTAMNARGEITGCTVFGPLAFDGAVSPMAAKKKGIANPVAGHADILLFHNIEAGNSTLKAMTIFGGFTFGGLLIGARAPIIVNSRSDSETSKLYSIACACLI